jgi:predicted kinase
MAKVIFTKGLPASGKSTWAKEYCAKNTDFVRVSRDDLRHMRGTYWLPKDEDMITDMEYYCIDAALSHNKNVIIDATNFNIKYRENIKKELLENFPDINFEEKDFSDVSLKTCIERDKKRANAVGQKVIERMYNKYLNPNQPIIQNIKLPKAIIVDLDGTLCIHNDRSPFEYIKCDTDLLNKTIAEIIRRYEYRVIFVSGREDYCKDKTITWLKKNGFLFWDLYMRKSGDTRPDYIIKGELYNEYIKDKNYIDFVLDDRDQVVNLCWRQFGFTCLQVAEGDF